MDTDDLKKIEVNLVEKYQNTLENLYFNTKSRRFPSIIDDRLSNEESIIFAEFDRSSRLGGPLVKPIARSFTKTIVDYTSAFKAKKFSDRKSNQII